MFVSRSMTRKVITVAPEQSVFEAQELMAHHSIRHLPVIDANQKLIGIVTDRDIRSAVPFNFIKDSCTAEQREQICSLAVKEGHALVGDGSGRFHRPLPFRMRF